MMVNRNRLIVALGLVLLLVASAIPAAPLHAQAEVGTPAWLPAATMYSLFVRSFRDSNGDGVGDLQGVIDGLDYLQSLGVDTIWLLPIFKATSYHGYDTIDYYTVEPAYGTNDDLARLISAMHERGMYLILDYVLNHTSIDHPYFKDALGNPASPYADYFEWTNDAHTEFRSFANLGGMPTLNYESAKVRQMALDIALHWLDPNKDGDFSDGIDGWRADVALDVPRSYWQEMRAALNTLNPQAVMLAELYTKDAQEMRRYLQGDQFHAAFDFPAAFVLSGEFERNGDGLLSGNGDANLLGTLIRAQRNLYCKDCVSVRFTHNHDTNRLASDVMGDQGRMRLAAVWLLTAPGVPILYYGEEIGMAGNKGGGPQYYDEYRREPFDWYATEAGAGMTTWFAPADRNNRPNDGVSVEEQHAKPESLLTLYRDLGALRHLPTFRTGAADNPKLPMPLVMSRHWDDTALYVAVTNFTQQPQTFPYLATFFEPENARYDMAMGETVMAQGYSLADEVSTLAPGGYVIFRFPK
jgi:glycosidase